MRLTEQSVGTTRGDVGAAPPAGAPGRGRRVSPAAPAGDTRARILEAAADSIAEDGVAAVRMAAIARRAGVSTALLHYHFATKEQLFEQVLSRTYESYAAPASTPAAARTVPAPQRLLDYLEGCLPGDSSLRRDLLLWQEFTTMAPRHEPMAATTSEYFRDDVARVAEIVRDGIAQGAFHVDDPQTAALAAIALVDGLCARVLARDPAVPLDEARRVLARSLPALLGAADPDVFRAPARAGVPAQSRRTHRTREAAR